MGLSPQQAKKILDASAFNLAKKVSEGKVLTAQERALVESVAAVDEKPVPVHTWAKSQVELADILGVTRLTVHRWLKEPGNPGRSSNGKYPVLAWLEFAKARGHDPEEEGSNQTALRAEQIRLQNQKLEFQIGILQREFVPTDKVEKWGGELGMEIKKVVQQIHSIAPSIVGLSVAEAAQRLRELEDEILGKLHLLRDRINDASAPERERIPT